MQKYVCSSLMGNWCKEKFFLRAPHLSRICAYVIFIFAGEKKITRVLLKKKRIENDICFDVCRNG